MPRAVRTRRSPAARQKPAPAKKPTAKARPLTRSVKKPAQKPARTTSKPAVPPQAPKRTEAQRRAELAAASETLRARIWGDQGQPLTTLGGVTIASAFLTRSRPHWHLLTFGLAPEGYELSLRVLRQKEDLAAPSWAVTLLSGLVTRAQQKTFTPDVNQALLLADGVAPGTESELSGLLFTVDPEAGSIVTPTESVPVLLAVPVAPDEARVVREWSPSGMVDVLSKVDPLLLTDLERPSLMSSPRARALIDQRVEREGSSLATMTASRSSASQKSGTVTWTLAVDAVDTLISLLKGRIGHLRPFTVQSDEGRVEVLSTDKPSVQLVEGVLTLRLSLVAARQIRSLLRATPGTYSFEVLPGFSLVVS